MPPPPTTHYHITVFVNSEFKGVACTFDWCIAHCNWIPTAIFIAWLPARCCK